MVLVDTSFYSQFVLALPFFLSMLDKAVYEFLLTGWVWSLPDLISGGFWLVRVPLFSLGLGCCIPVSLKKGLVTDSFSCLEGFAVCQSYWFILFLNMDPQNDCDLIRLDLGWVKSVLLY
jgi:hypothetical protein